MALGNSINFPVCTELSLTTQNIHVFAWKLNKPIKCSISNLFVLHLSQLSIIQLDMFRLLCSLFLTWQMPIYRHYNHKCS